MDCDFTSIQTAVDGSGTPGEAIIEITDPVHTKAGIVVSRGWNSAEGARQLLSSAQRRQQDVPTRLQPVVVQCTRNFSTPFSSYYTKGTVMPLNESTSLLKRVRSGDQRALARAYDEYAPAIYRYAYRLTGHEGTAQDVTSETFHKLLASLRKGGGPTDNLSAWLYRVAHNLAVDGYRQQADNPPMALDQAPEIAVAAQQEARLERQERVDRARRALQKLTSLQQQVISLRFLEELSIKETAKAMDKTEGAVKSLQFRAMSSLQRILEETDGQT